MEKQKKYICIQPCVLGGKRYEIGEDLPDGVKPTQFFKDVETGEVVPAPKVEKKETENAVAKEGEKSNTLILELQEQVNALYQELETIKNGVAGEIDELKAAVISLSDKVDLMEAEIKKRPSSPETVNVPDDKPVKIGK